MTAGEVLRRARALIESPEKWMQGLYDDGKGAYCMLGALFVAERTRTDRVERQATSALYAVVPGPPSTWNDDPRRTHAEVLAAYDDAIELAEASS